MWGDSGPERPHSSEVKAPLADPPVFTLQSKAAASATREWTEQETLLLLEVIGARKREACMTEVARCLRTRERGSVILPSVSLLPDACRTCPRQQLQARDLGHFLNAISVLSATCKFLLDPTEHTNTKDREL